MAAGAPFPRIARKVSDSSERLLQTSIPEASGARIGPASDPLCLPFSSGSFFFSRGSTHFASTHTHTRTYIYNRDVSAQRVTTNMGEEQVLRPNPFPSLFVSISVLVRLFCTETHSSRALPTPSSYLIPLLVVRIVDSRHANLYTCLFTLFIRVIYIVCICIYSFIYKVFILLFIGGVLCVFDWMAECDRSRGDRRRYYQTKLPPNKKAHSTTRMRGTEYQCRAAPLCCIAAGFSPANGNRTTESGSVQHQTARRWPIKFRNEPVREFARDVTDFSGCAEARAITLPNNRGGRGASGARLPRFRRNRA